MMSVREHHVIVAADGDGQRVYLARDNSIIVGDLVSFCVVTIKFNGAHRYVAANCRRVKSDYLERSSTPYGTLFHAKGHIVVTDEGYFLQEPYVGRIPLSGGPQLKELQPRAHINPPFRAYFDAASMTVELQIQQVCESHGARDFISRRDQMLALIAAKSGEAVVEDRVMLNYEYHKVRHQSTLKSCRRDPTSYLTLLTPLYAQSAVNAVLRALIHTTSFRDVFTAGVFARYVNLHDDNGTQGKLSAHISALLDLAHSGQFDEISAEGFYRFAAKHLQWSGRYASEFIVCLLDKLHAETLKHTRECDGATAEAHCSDGTTKTTMESASPVQDLFSTRLMFVDKCQRCDHTNASVKDVLVLHIPFSAYHLSACLEQHFSLPLKHAVCACGGNVERKTRIQSLPPVLVINLDHDGNGRLSEVPETLDLLHTTEGPIESTSYQLFAAVVDEECKSTSQANATEWTEEALEETVRNQTEEFADDDPVTSAYIRHPDDPDVWLNFFELTPVVDGKLRPQTHLWVLDKEASEKPLRRGYLFFYKQL